MFALLSCYEEMIAYNKWSNNINAYVNGSGLFNVSCWGDSVL